MERPDNLRYQSSSAHLFVKLNGGLAYHGDLEEQVSIGAAHLERLAAHIPDVLPRFLRAELQRRSFLFMGHGLAEPDVRALIEYSAGDDRVMRSWAVQARPFESTFLRAWQDDVEHWPMFGLQVLEADLSRFSAALCRRIAEGSRAPTSSNIPPPGKRGLAGRLGIVFVSYPSDIAAPIMKQIVSEVIARGLRVWLWDPLPFGFSDQEAGKIISLVHGEHWLEATHQAARNADAVLFLISQRTLQSEFQRYELAIGLDRGRAVPCIVDEGVEPRRCSRNCKSCTWPKLQSNRCSPTRAKPGWASSSKTCSARRRPNESQPAQRDVNLFRAGSTHGLYRLRSGATWRGLYVQHNKAADGATSIDAEYLEVVAKRT